MDDACIRPQPPARGHAGRATATAVLQAALVLAIGACGPSDGATLEGSLISVSLPANTRLVVQVCEQARPDCDRWLYPDANGAFHIEKLEPGVYTVAVFLETSSGLEPVSSSLANLIAGEATVVDLHIPVIPPGPAP